MHCTHIRLAPTMGIFIRSPATPPRHCKLDSPDEDNCRTPVIATIRKRTGASFVNISPGYDADCANMAKEDAIEHIRLIATGEGRAYN